MTRRVLVDPSGPITMQVVEGKQGGKLVVEGKIGQCDVPTANGRVYPRKVMEREVNRLAPRIEAVSVMSAVDHPLDGKTRLKDAGAIVRKFWVEPSGEIMGRFEVVEEAPAGQALAAFLRRGASVGVSSRGMGSTVPGPGGHDIVGEDFRLSTWDFVSDPACQDAYPAIVSESEEAKITEDHLRARFPQIVRGIEERAYSTAQAVCEEVATDDVRADVERETEEALKLASTRIREEVKVEVYDEVRKQMSEDFAVKLVRSLAEMRDAITEEVKSDLSSDPEIAGAKVTLKKIAEMIAPFKPTGDAKKMLDEKDGAAAALKQQTAKLESDLDAAQKKVTMLETKGRQLAYALYVEQRISGRADGDNIRKLIGDVTGITKVEDLKARVDAAIAEADKFAETVNAQAAATVNKTTVEAEQKIATAQREVQAAVVRERKLRESVEARISDITEQLKTIVAAKDAEIDEIRARLDAQSDEHDRADLIAYAIDRTQGHREQKSIVESVQSGRLNSKGDINKVVRRLEDGAHEPGGVNERVRRAMARGRESMTEDETRVEAQVEAETAASGGEAARDLSEIGMSLTEQTSLTGKTRRRA